MNIVLPPEVMRRVTESSVKLHLAIGLYASDEVTLGQAATIAGTSPSALLRELGRRKIPVHYDAVDLDADIETVRKLASSAQER